jgi:hypothetical protein
MWGVIPAVAEAAALDDADALARRLAREKGIAADGQAILVVRGLTSGPLAGAPSITVLTL